MGEMKLKPCPFCGGEASIDEWGEGMGKILSIHCLNPSNDCRFSMSRLAKDKDELITAWNRRASRWNKFLDQKPREWQDCVVITERGDVHIYTWSEAMYAWWEGNAITHWIELPTDHYRSCWRTNQKEQHKDSAPIDQIPEVEK
jgi:Lar family restriction alleviation protein